MNIQTSLLTGPAHAKIFANQIADYACTSPETFHELVECFLSKDNRLSQRAARSLSIAAIKRPEYIEPYIEMLVGQLKRTDAHDAILRNITRILEQINIPEKFHGDVMDTCFKFIRKRQTAIAIRAYSLTILFNLSNIYPEIKDELRYAIEESMAYEKPAILSRGRKILASFKEK
ncbi:hypothetical protein [Dyadobacter luticola]|uniref:HEAT repeat domain-containing protein n=1 Tax=Dyadobacter luticola TaxID=1979387 RepID=A0A5R9KSD9_9BACT|nr:hypothetical protein [Dyadobacter luticola]TLU99130.1 hypothetical protein FEN17_21370 [Dyadobacter luticola]